METKSPHRDCRLNISSKIKVINTSYLPECTATCSHSLWCVCVRVCVESVWALFMRAVHRQCAGTWSLPANSFIEWLSFYFNRTDCALEAETSPLPASLKTAQLIRAVVHCHYNTTACFLTTEQKRNEINQISNFFFLWHIIPAAMSETHARTIS